MAVIRPRLMGRTGQRTFPAPGAASAGALSSLSPGQEPGQQGPVQV